MEIDQEENNMDADNTLKVPSTSANNIENQEPGQVDSVNNETIKSPFPANYSPTLIQHSEVDTGDMQTLSRKPKMGPILDDSDNESANIELSANERSDTDNVMIVRKKNKSKLVFDDSDSDNEASKFLQESDQLENNIENKEPERVKPLNNYSPEVDDAEDISRQHILEPILDNSDNEQHDFDNLKTIARRKHKSKLVFDDSDSDNEDSKKIEESNKLDNNEEKTTLETNKKLKRIAFFDSDSEVEDMDVITPHNKSFDHAEIIPETDSVIQKSRLETLCDADSDEYAVPAIVEPTHHVVAKKSKLTHEPKKMTAKEAAEQRQEIQSESQRMLREKNVSLPYHKPKSRSLKEFLARRPKLSRAVSVVGHAPPSVAIKMSSEQLELISKQLKEREREVKAFYKSSSESEDEDEPNKKSGDLESEVKDDLEPKDANLNQENATSQSDENTTSNMECTQNLDSELIQSTTDQTNNIGMQAQNKEEFTQPLSEETSLNTCEISTESYDFNLDNDGQEVDATERPKANEEPTLKPKSTDFVYTELDREIENWQNPQEEVVQENTSLPVPGKSKLELLREQLANDKPRLSGGPDEIIDLDSGVAKPQEVVQLMERFAKHVATKKPHTKHKVKLSIVTVESGGDIHKEEVAVNVDSDEESPVIEEKPGAKLQKLREELQKQMEQKKTEIWQQKAAKGFKAGFEENLDTEDGADYDEEEAEETEEEYTDEEIEDDVDMTDKPLKESAFLDQEAEVSGDDEEMEGTSKEGYEDNVEQVNEDEEEENEDDEINEPEQPEEEQGEKKRVLKRIVKPVDDSDEEDLFNDSVVHKSTINVHLDSTVTADEDEIPPHQTEQLHTPHKPLVSQTKSITDFLTPISFITSIQNLASASKSIKEGSAISPFRMPSDLRSPLNQMAQKKLFADSDILESQSSVDMALTDTSQELSSDLKDKAQTISEPTQEVPNTQDLLGICSGEFTGVTQGNFSESSKELTGIGISQNEVQSLGQEDMIISQLLDEEEMERFKKKFESPVNVNPTFQHNLLVEAEEIAGGGVIDSDDEDENGYKKKKNNQKRIQFLDDDSSSEENENNEEEIDLQDTEGLDENIDNVAYDSEENEIEVDAEGKSEKIKLADFVEAEAELSESEWGSEDEDEKDLDQLEFELGDTEKFDEDQVKTDLEKIHMRRMLDDDTREVKLLQELLLEDGEMHGTGRQRQFKWRNIDLEGDLEVEKKEDDDIYLDEEESEEQWRKQRHQREMFLKQQQQKGQSIESDENLLANSQLLKIGQKFLQRSLSHSSQNSTPTEKNKADTENPFKNTPFNFENMRGSFLNRNDEVLQRVAEYTKITEEVNVSSKKTTKHFLFQSVSATEVSVISGEGKKRKASEGTPNILKKLRLNTNLSPAVKKKQLNKPERSKKLFNF